MKYILLIFTAAMLASCSDSFINKTLTYEKQGDCSGDRSSTKMNSTINGERYEFVRCLDDGFDGKKYSVERKGDSLVVSFSSTGGAKASYKLTLDIDAKPVYNFINLDGEVIPIVHQQ